MANQSTTGFGFKAAMRLGNTPASVPAGTKPKPDVFLLAIVVFSYFNSCLFNPIVGNWLLSREFLN